MATARKTPGRKKAGTKKAGRKTAAKKSTAKSEIPVKAGPAETSLEARFLGPLAELERLLDQVRRRDWFRPFSREWPAWREFPALFEARTPSIDVVDRDKEIFVRAEVPGIDKEDLDVSVTDRTLTIKGESRHEEKQEEGDLYRHEIRTGSFSRTVTLPADVNGSKATASYKDGVVELHLPKLRKSKRHKVKLSES